MDLLYNTLGNIGMVSLLIGYFLVQKKKIGATDYPYLFINFSGSLLLIFSLMHHWNLPAFLLECAWCLISIYGLIQRYRRGTSA